MSGAVRAWNGVVLRIGATAALMPPKLPREAVVRDEGAWHFDWAGCLDDWTRCLANPMFPRRVEFPVMCDACRRSFMRRVASPRSQRERACRTSLLSEPTMISRCLQLPVLAVASLLLAGSRGMAQKAAPDRWIATWAASQFAAPQRPPADSVDRIPTIANRTIREIVRVSAGGSRVRIRLSNQGGDRPLVVGSVHVALRTSGAAIDPS